MNGTEYSSEVAERPTQYIVQWLVCLFGLVGNALVLYIYLRKRAKAPSETFIIVTALLDFSMNLASMLFTVVRIFNYGPVILQFCISSNAVFDLINTSSSLLVCAMTVNRYIAICRPHSYSEVFTAGRVNRLLLLTAALGVASCTPSVTNCFIYFTLAGQRFKPEGSDTDLVKLAWVGIRITLLLVATALMAVLYYRVAVTIVHKRRAAAAATAATPGGQPNSPGVKSPPPQSPSSVDNSLTLTLFSISVAYVLLTMPDVSVNLLDSFNLFSIHQFERYRTATQALFTVNFVTNPLIYLLCNQYFKTQLHTLLCRCPCPAQAPPAESSL